MDSRSEEAIDVRVRKFLAWLASDAAWKNDGIDIGVGTQEVPASSEACCNAQDGAKQLLAALSAIQGEGTRESGLREAAARLDAYLAIQPTPRDDLPDPNKHFSAGFLSGVRTSAHVLRSRISASPKSKASGMESVLVPRREIEHALRDLKYRATGKDPKNDGYEYAEVPAWRLRGWLLPAPH